MLWIFVANILLFVTNLEEDCVQFLNLQISGIKDVMLSQQTFKF